MTLEQIKNDPFRKMRFRNLTREIDATESEMLRAAFNRTRKSRRDVAALRAHLSELTRQRAALAWESV